MISIFSNIIDPEISEQDQNNFKPWQNKDQINNYNLFNLLNQNLNKYQHSYKHENPNQRKSKDLGRLKCQNLQRYRKSESVQLPQISQIQKNSYSKQQKSIKLKSNTKKQQGQKQLNHFEQDEEIFHVRSKHCKLKTISFQIQKKRNSKIKKRKFSLHENNNKFFKNQHNIECQNEQKSKNVQNLAFNIIRPLKAITNQQQSHNLLQKSSQKKQIKLFFKKKQLNLNNINQKNDMQLNTNSNIKIPNLNLKENNKNKCKNLKQNINSFVPKHNKNDKNVYLMQMMREVIRNKKNKQQKSKKNQEQQYYNGCNYPIPRRYNTSNLSHINMNEFNDQNMHNFNLQIPQRRNKI